MQLCTGLQIALDKCTKKYPNIPFFFSSCTTKKKCSDSSVICQLANYPVVHLAYSCCSKHFGIQWMNHEQWINEVYRRKVCRPQHLSCQCHCACVQKAPFQTKQSRESEFRFCSRQCTIAYCTSLNILLLLLHWRHQSSTPCLFFRTTCSYSWCDIGRISWWVQSRQSLLAQHEDWHHLGICGACFVCLNGMPFHLLPLSFVSEIIPSGVTSTTFKKMLIVAPMEWFKESKSPFIFCQTMGKDLHLHYLTLDGNFPRCVFLVVLFILFYLNECVYFPALFDFIKLWNARGEG